MADETIFAVLDADGEVINTIVADQAYIDTLVKQIDDPRVDTGDLRPDYKFADITTKSPRPGVGWKRSNNGRFVAPPLPPPVVEPTPQEIAAAAEAAEAARVAREQDDAFVAAMLVKARKGTALTDAEQQRLDLIRLSRVSEP